MVTLVWIPAHKGHPGNETADELAKQGTELETISDSVRIPASHMKSTIRKSLYQLWTEEWQNSPQGSHTKHFYAAPDQHKAKYVYKLARLELGRFVRLITGHNNLNYFQYKIKYSPTHLCRFCNEAEESMLHLVNDCPRFLTFRRDTFLGQQPRPDRKWSVRSLLEFSYIPSINEAFEGTWAHMDPSNEDILDESLTLNTTDDDSTE